VRGVVLYDSSHRHLRRLGADDLPFVRNIWRPPLFGRSRRRVLSLLLWTVLLMLIESLTHSRLSCGDEATARVAECTTKELWQK
jgi:hypothetical protein